jgi:hypothetical protein
MLSFSSYYNVALITDNIKCHWSSKKSMDARIHERNAFVTIFTEKN